ncbi:MAG: HAD family hydrolase [Bacteroidota bacterium]
MSEIRSVAFDGNGVLYYRDSEVVDSVIASARERGLTLPDDARQRYTHLMHEAFRGSMTREQMVEAILDSWNVSEPEHRSALADAITRASRTIRLYPGVIPTLARLKQLGIGTGVITNTFQSSEEKWLWFRTQGIASYLDRIISSIEVGVAKPDPAIYALYVQACGLRPEEVAFVGHDLGELYGAQQAGLVCLAFRPDQPGVFEPEFFNFADLVPLIGAGEAAGT